PTWGRRTKQPDERAERLLDKKRIAILQLCMNESLLATLGLGFVLGLKHATEADHLVAISTIVSERRSIWESASVGALWGVGHTASLLVAGFFVIALGIAIPERVASLLELAVALMIIFLGTRLLYRIL